MSRVTHDTLPFFQYGKITKKSKVNNVKERYVRKIKREIEKYGFAYIDKKEVILEEILMEFNDLEVKILDTNYLVSDKNFFKDYVNEATTKN